MSHRSEPSIRNYGEPESTEDIIAAACAELGIAAQPWTSFDDEVLAFIKNPDFDPEMHGDWDGSNDSDKKEQLPESALQTKYESGHPIASMLYIQHLAAREQGKPKCKRCRKNHEGISTPPCPKTANHVDCPLLCTECMKDAHDVQNKDVSLKPSLPPPVPGEHSFHPEVAAWLIAPSDHEMPPLRTSFEPQDLGLVNKAYSEKNCLSESTANLTHSISGQILRESISEELYTPLNIDKEEIRILFLLPAAWSGPIKCDLHTISLKSRPQYQALSYAWGDPNDLRQISINQTHKFDVTASLESALRRLRNPTKVLTLWADAVSINQNDIEEKGNQVTLMDRIYSQASEVQAWLGEDVPSGNSVETSRSAVRVLQCLASDFHFKDLPFYRGADPTIDPFDWNGPRLQRSFIDFVSRPWWTRAWVVQEIVLAPKVTLHAGHTSVNWDLVAAAAMSMEKHRSTCCASERDNLIWREYLPYFTKFSRNVCAIQKLRTELHGVQFFTSHIADLPLKMTGSASTAQNVYQPALKLMKRALRARENDELLRLLSSFRSRQASDARDKVYSFLGLVGRRTRNQLPPPDYSSTTEEAVYKFYTDTARSLITSSTSLRMLLENEDQEGRHSGSLPSWVPEWSSPRDIEESGLFTLHLRGLYNACGNVARFAEVNENLLSLRAVKIDVVDRVGEAMEEKYTRQEARVHQSWLDLSEDYYRGVNNPSPYGSHVEVDNLETAGTSFFVNSFDETHNGWLNAFWRTLFSDVQFLDPPKIVEAPDSVRVWPLENGLAVRRCIPLDAPSYLSWQLDQLGGKDKMLEKLEEKLAGIPTSCSAPITHQDQTQLGSHGKSPNKDERSPINHSFGGVQMQEEDYNMIQALRSGVNFGLEEILPPGVTLTSIYQTVRSSTASRRFFITKQGYMGLGVRDMKKGDVIMVVAGLEVPLLFRASDVENSSEENGTPSCHSETKQKDDAREQLQNQRWQLVGSCYVHGIMDGEAAGQERWNEDAVNICVE